MSTPRYRYPGARPFGSEEEALFNGREQDSLRLARLIRLEQIVVLYGRSGIGKSSLLKAAVVPQLAREDAPSFLTIPMRFDSHNELADPDDAPLFNLLQVLRKHRQVGDWTDRFGDTAPLWQALKSVQFACPGRTILLIFDQFEELFTYPLEATHAFAVGLAQALYERVPQPCRDLLEAGAVHLDEAETDALYVSRQIKVVFVIHSDRFYLLDSLKPYLPQIFQKTYELKSLSRAQAEDAILNPANLNDAGLTIPPFDYTDGALDAILDYLTKSNTDIETTQLQIICRHAERLVEAGKIATHTQSGIPQVTRDDLGDLGVVFSR